MTLSALGTELVLTAANALTTDYADNTYLLPLKETSSYMHPPPAPAWGAAIYATYIAGTTGVADDLALSVRLALNSGDGTYYDMPDLEWAIATPTPSTTYTRRILVYPILGHETVLQVKAKLGTLCTLADGTIELSALLLNPTIFAA